jgi:hypothetical protein
MLLVLGVFSAIAISSLKRGRWQMVCDRGGLGKPAEIRWQGKQLPASLVRCITTRPGVGSPPRSIVVAELHNGAVEHLGFSGLLTWPAYYGQQIATWMGIAYRPGSS